MSRSYRQMSKSYWQMSGHVDKCQVVLKNFRSSWQISGHIHNCQGHVDKCQVMLTNVRLCWQMSRSSFQCQGQVEGYLYSCPSSEVRSGIAWKSLFNSWPVNFSRAWRAKGWVSIHIRVLFGFTKFSCVFLQISNA